MNQLGIRTLQDLLNNLDRLGYSKSVMNQIRPRLKESGKFYRQPLSRIPADYDKFVERWGTGRSAALEDGFDSHEHFLEWRKRVRGALARIQLRQGVAPDVLPDWQPVLDVIEANSGPQKALGPHRMEGVQLLAQVASGDGYRPVDLVGPTITRVASSLKGPKRRTFKRGVSALNQLLDHPDLIVGIAHLLPATHLPQPDQVKSAPSTRRRGGPAEDSEFWAAFDEFVLLKRGVDELGRPIPAADSEFKPRTAETYENALNNATGVLERAGVLRPGDTISLRELCSHEVISKVADLWQVRMLDGEVSKEASTLHLTVERLSHIATYSKFLSKKERKKLQKTRDKVRKKAKRRGKMSAPREAWIKAFARSTPQQLAVHTMPETLMRKAQPILDDWENLKRKRKHKLRMRALHLGIAAVQAAILFRGSAVRAVNLRQLPFRGDDAQLILCPDGRDVRISIPEHLVKNGVKIETDFDDDARPVIDWYIKEIRPKLLADHPYGHNLTDSDFLFPSKRAGAAMEETTFAEHYRHGAEAVGLDMTLHQARHITVFFILSEDPSAIALAAAALADETSTVEAHYAFFDFVRAVIEGRELLKQSRKAARKHKAGGRR